VSMLANERCLAVVRWKNDDYERPWLVKNPDEIRQFVGLLVDVKRDRELTVAMETDGHLW